MVKTRMTLRNSEKMPLLFIGHGSPMNAVEENEFVAGWRKAAISLEKPDAVLCISAHWETRGTFVTAMEKPRTIHDFGGFPKVLYDIEYPAPGSPGLAADTKNIVKSAELGLDDKWGLDHGCWSVMKHLFPEADVPVVQMSLDYTRSPKEHYELAKELLSIRKKGILVVGSGNIVHNLGLVSWSKINETGFGYDWAMEANEKIKRSVLSGDHNPLINYRQQGSEMNLAIPTPEHFLPLLYVLAMKQESDSIDVFNDKAVAGSLTMTSFLIRPGK